MPIELERIVARIEGDLSGLNNALRDVQGKLGGLQRVFDDSGQKMRSSFNGVQKVSLSLKDTLISIIPILVAMKGIQIFKNMISDGIRFNSVMETSELGIATLITAQADLVDAVGKTLKPQEALNAAIEISKEQMDKLRIAGIQTSATTEQLVTAFQQAVGAGLSAKLTMDEIRKVTIQVVQAAGALGVPMFGVAQEVRAILSGTIDMNARIAVALGLTSRQVQQWKQQGTLAKELLNLLGPFTAAGERITQTWQAMTSNVKEARDTLAGFVTSGLFETIRKASLKALSGVFDLDTAQISQQFTGVANTLKGIFDIVGEEVGKIILGMVEALAQLSTVLDENKARGKDMAESIREGLKRIPEVIGDLIVKVAGVVDSLAGVRIAVGNVIAFLFNIITSLPPFMLQLGILGAVLFGRQGLRWFAIISVLDIATKKLGDTIAGLMGRELPPGQSALELALGTEKDIRDQIGPAERAAKDFVTKVIGATRGAAPVGGLDKFTADIFGLGEKGIIVSGLSEAIERAKQEMGEKKLLEVDIRAKARLDEKALEDQRKELDSLASSFAGKLGFSFDTFKEDMEEILSATIGVREQLFGIGNELAGSLGITNEMVEAWKESGDFVERLTAKIVDLAKGGGLRGLEEQRKKLKELADEEERRVEANERIMEALRGQVSTTIDLNREALVNISGMILGPGGRAPMPAGLGTMRRQPLDERFKGDPKLDKTNLLLTNIEKLIRGQGGRELVPVAQ